MMKKYLTPLLLLLILTNTALSALIPETKQDYCARFGSRPQDLEIIQDLATDPNNLISFKNDGGLFNGGVCWWHSRFQRNILYLSLFRPDLAKPKSNRELVALIHQIRLGQSVVTIPGYANLAEFSSANQKLIQSELNDWQLYDGVVLGGWMDGLKGNTEVEAATLTSMMNEVYEYVTVKKKIAYEKLQIKGITSHAWLIVGMKKMPLGIDLGFIDSNNPRMSEVYSYKTGDKSFFIKGYGNFVPYLEFKREEQRLVDTAAAFCGLKTLSKKIEDERNYRLDLEEARRIHKVSDN